LSAILALPISKLATTEPKKGKPDE